MDPVRESRGRGDPSREGSSEGAVNLFTPAPLTYGTIRRSQLRYLILWI